MEFGTEFWAAITGALVGSASGAIPAYLLAVRTSREALSKEKEERARTQHDRVFRTFLVLSECLADAVDHLREIERQLVANAPIRADGYPISAMVQPIANLDFIGEFEAKSDDLLVFVEGGEVEFAQSIRLRVKQYNSIVECFKKFTALKEDFGLYIQSQEGLSITPTGGISGQVSQRVSERIEAKRAQMESVIVETRAHLRETALDLVELASRFGPIARKCTPKGLAVVGFADDQIEKLRTELRSLPS